MTEKLPEKDNKWYKLVSDTIFGVFEIGRSSHYDVMVVLSIILKQVILNESKKLLYSESDLFESFKRIYEAIRVDEVKKE